MARAVVYCSKHGSTKEIAKLIGKKYNLPVIDIKDITGYSYQSVPVIFCGWVRNRKVQGLKKAQRLFECEEIVAVGSNEENEAVRLKLKYANGIDKSIFTYIQSSPFIKATLLEKAWIYVFKPSLLPYIKKEELGNEFSI